MVKTLKQKKKSWYKPTVISWRYRLVFTETTSRTKKIMNKLI